MIKLVEDIQVHHGIYYVPIPLKSLQCSFLEQLSESCLVEMGNQIGSFRRSRAQPAQLRQRVPIVSDNADL